MPSSHNEELRDTHNEELRATPEQDGVVKDASNAAGVFEYASKANEKATQNEELSANPEQAVT